MSLTKVTYSMIKGSPVNVLDFGADSTGVADSTAAIASAIAQGGQVYFPKGTYLCNIEITNTDGIYLLGETQGQHSNEGARLVPFDDTKPVIDVVGPVVGCIVENFILDSKADSTYSHTGIGLRVKAASPDFVWRSAFRHLFIRGFQDGLVIDCDAGLGEVFDNDFTDIEAIGCDRYSFYTLGVYNTYNKLFATQCGDWVLYNEGSQSLFNSVVGDGRVSNTGAGNIFNNLKIEAIHGAGGYPLYPVIELNGTTTTLNNVLIADVSNAKYQYGISIYGAGHIVSGVRVSGTDYPSIPLVLNSASGGIINNFPAPVGVTPVSAGSAILQNWSFFGDMSNVFNATTVSASGVHFGNNVTPSDTFTTLDYYRKDAFTATATGMTTSPTGIVNYTRVGNIVTLDFPLISGTSNNTQFTLTGMPTNIRPVGAGKRVLVRITDNSGAISLGTAHIQTSGVIDIGVGAASSAFTASGTKSIEVCSVSYTIA